MKLTTVSRWICAGAAGLWLAMPGPAAALLGGVPGPLHPAHSEQAPVHAAALAMARPAGAQAIGSVVPQPRPQRASYQLAPSASLRPAPRPATLRQVVRSRPAPPVPLNEIVAETKPGLPRAVQKGWHHWIWCVPYVQAITHIDIHADAWQWWSRAAHRYARGKEPAPGAVLTFRPIHRMPLGHVAVVAQIKSPREVLVNQANWVPNTVTMDTAVIDVSAKNDWSEVRVQNLDGSFGGVYPTFGFIYDGPPRKG